MMLLAHLGITLGTAVLFTGGLVSVRHQIDREDTPKASQDRAFYITSIIHRWLYSISSWVTSLGRHIDIRLLLLGAIVPDIIDKPVGQLFFSDAFSNGRIFSHTLLFPIILAAIGCCVYRSRSKPWLMVIAGGSFMHLLLDQMWGAPETLFWPLVGTDFPKEDITGWITNTLDGLIKNPAVFIPELIGAIVLVWFATILLHERKALAFIIRGQV
ncbi:metal-dependent hydrolase [Chloroflexota bacterium]